MRRETRRLEWTALGLITLAAAVLRLIHIGQVSPDPFYDAAVRSMALSWHNFFFGAFEPGASVSIDKPPVDLWLQVASVKLLGFSSTTLKLPEAFAGTATVPLLFACVRRLWGPAAGLAAALAIAVLPVEVITSRSDTMDAVMMALIVGWVSRRDRVNADAAIGIVLVGSLAWGFVSLAVYQHRRMTGAPAVPARLTIHTSAGRSVERLPRGLFLPARRFFTAAAARHESQRNDRNGYQAERAHPPRRARDTWTASVDSPTRASTWLRR